MEIVCIIFLYSTRALSPRLITVDFEKAKGNFTLSNTNYEDPITDHILIDPVVSSSDQKLIKSP